MNNRVLTIGPSKKTEGGITSVIKEYANNDLWQKYSCKWIETYYTRGFFLKIVYFIKGFLKYLFFLPICRIVHIHLSWESTAIRKLAFFVCARILRKKVIIHLHSGAEPIINSGVKWIYKHYFKKADITILLAHAIKKQLLKEFKFKRIEVIYNPCPIRLKTNSIEKHKTILFAGHIKETKGVFDLLLAFSKISKKSPDWNLLIAGSGNIHKLNNLILSLNIVKQVKFLGWIRGTLKADTFNMSSIFCLPSYTEGFPMAVLDAWAYGLPVITTPVGGLPDVLKHNVNALVFEPGNINHLKENLEELIRSEELRNKLSEASFQLSNDLFNINSISRQLDELYQTLINN